MGRTSPLFVKLQGEDADPGRTVFYEELPKRHISDQLQSIHLANYLRECSKMNRDCFVIMPFEDRFNEYWSELISPTLKKCGYNPSRADSIYSSRSVFLDIYEGIIQSHLVLADVTGRNPNVNYELGIAHSLGKPVLILTQDIDHVPFDYRHIRCIVYNTSRIKWEKTLKSKIVKTIGEIDKNPKKHVAFAPQEVDDYSIVRNHFRSIAINLRAVMSKEEVVRCDERGHCSFQQELTIDPKTDLSSFPQNIAVDEKGEIEVEHVFDILSNRALSTLDIRRSDDTLGYVILFDELKARNTPIRLKIEMKAENYMSDLIQKGESEVFYQNAMTSNIEYGSVVSEYSFPDVASFASISVQYLWHPNNALNGTEIKLRKKDGRITCVADFSVDNPQQSPFGVKFTLA